MTAGTVKAAASAIALMLCVTSAEPAPERPSQPAGDLERAQAALKRVVTRRR